MKYLRTVLIIVFVVSLAIYVTPHSRVRGQESPAIVAGRIYYIRNLGSSKYLNVHAGIQVADDGRNVNQDYDYGFPLAQQQWHMVYEPTDQAYWLYPMNSHAGTRLAMSISRQGGLIQAGCNVEVFTATHDGSTWHDPVAKHWRIFALSNGTFRISPSSAPHLALTVFGTSVGTNDGRTPTSPGNVFVTTYTGEGTAFQQWQIMGAGDAFPHNPFRTNPYASMGWAFMYDSPLHRRISSGYKRYPRPTHNGVDVVHNTLGSAGINGVPVLSVNSGIVTWADWSASAGWWVAIRTDSQDPSRNNRNIIVRYLHLASRPPVVRDQRVTRGQVVGLTGNTGQSFGAHLHFDVNTDGHAPPTAAAAINPQKFFPATFLGRTSPID